MTILLASFTFPEILVVGPETRFKARICKLTIVKDWPAKSGIVTKGMPLLTNRMMLLP